MPRVGFEPTTQVFEREKTVHALDSTATVIGLRSSQPKINSTVASHILVRLPSGHFPKDVCRRILYELSFSQFSYIFHRTILGTCSVHHNFLDLITLTTVGEDYILWSCH
jgi:hypothetical protein